MADMMRLLESLQENGISKRIFPFSFSDNLPRLRFPLLTPAEPGKMTYSAPKWTSIAPLKWKRSPANIRAWSTTYF